MRASIPVNWTLGVNICVESDVQVENMKILHLNVESKAPKHTYVYVSMCMLHVVLPQTLVHVNFFEFWS